MIGDKTGQSQWRAFLQDWTLLEPPDLKLRTRSRIFRGRRADAIAIVRTDVSIERPS